tara:strand:- start:342 stop:845 length:504 start_codon:yes stop_codon:yes gene_type:complete
MASSLKYLKSIGTVRLGRFILGLIGIGFFGAYLTMALEMPVGGVGNPGPGLWPTIVGITGLAMSGLLALEALFLASSASGNIELPRGPLLFKVAGLLGFALLYIMAIPVLGQLVGSFLFFVSIIRLMNEVGWIKSLLLGALASGVIHFSFAVLLGLRLPVGVFGIGG